MVMESYILDFGGTELQSWRLREEPDLDAGEIGEFHHGDTITAVKDQAHPGWLKLADKAGWVKESHEDYLVWKIAKFWDPAPAACAPPASDSPASSSKDCEKDNSFAPSKASSSGSEGSSTAQDRALVEARLPPRPFMGQGYRLGDEGGLCSLAFHAADDGSAKSEVSRWFTGQSYRIALAVEEEEKSDGVAAALKARAARPRWADMADTDEEEVESDSEDSQGLHLASKEENPPDELQESGAEAWQEIPPEREPETEQQCLQKSRRQKRNKKLLQKNGKTQMCRYLVEQGSCPFGDACWFAHSEAEMHCGAAAEVQKAMPAQEEDGTLCPGRQTRIAPTRSQAPPTDKSEAAARDAPAARPQWADMADTDEEAEDGKENVGPILLGYRHTTKEETVKDLSEHAAAVRPQLLQEPESEPQCTAAPRRKRRNRELLQRRCKTQLCRYLATEGSCPFGDSCWFAHSEAELKGGEASAESGTGGSQGVAF